MKKDTKEILSENLEKLIKEVEEAGDWIRPFKKAIALGMPKNAKTLEHYKGANIFMLWLKTIEENYSSNEWLTYKQCKALKGYVKEGEKGTPIFFFKPIQITEEMENLKTGVKEDTKITIPMAKMYYVFNIEQTTLKELTEEENKSINPNPFKIDIAEEFYSKLNFLEVKEKKYPYYSPSLDYIGMPNIYDFINNEEYYSTLGHEYIHSTGAKNRLDRKLETKSSKSYAFEELIAEIGSVFIMSYLGINTEPTQKNSASYLKGWLEELKSDKTYFWKASSEAFKAFDYLLYCIEKEKENKVA